MYPRAPRAHEEDRTEDCAYGADDDVIHTAKSSKKDDSRGMNMAAAVWAAAAITGHEKEHERSEAVDDTERIAGRTSLVYRFIKYSLI